jgi:hypothetical protein
MENRSTDSNLKPAKIFLPFQNKKSPFIHRDPKIIYFLPVNFLAV